MLRRGIMVEIMEVFAEIFNVHDITLFACSRTGISYYECLRFIFIGFTKCYEELKVINELGSSTEVL